MGTGFSIKAKANAEADVYIYEDVGESFFGGVSAKQFAAELKSAGSVQKINLHLNTMGGDVFDGMAIYRQLVDHSAKVVTYIDGAAASIGSVIAMAGNEIKISEAGFMMIHDAWGQAVGGPEDMRSMADLMEKASGSIADVYQARTRKPMEKIRAWMKDETWFTGDEAVKEGFADSLMENMRVAAKFDASRHKFRNAPQALTAPVETPALTPVLRPKYDEFAARLALMKAKTDVRRFARA